MKDNPAAVSKLLKKVRDKNLVPSILKMKLDGKTGDQILADIARRVTDDRGADKKSMQPWEKFLDAGRKLTIQEIEAKSEPWDGAANFKSPAILEAALRFGDRASSTLLKPRDMVKYDVIGSDKDKSKEKRGKRISTHMNYQLNYEMKTWRADQDQLHYIIPGDGCMFKFTYFDSTLGANASELVRWPDFRVNQANTSMETCRSFTIDREYTHSMVLSKIREGIWHEYPEVLEQMGAEKQDEQKTAEESADRFFIQQMYFDLDGDGYEEPYMATVHEATSKVVRVIARYEEDNIVVKTPNGRVLGLDEVIGGKDGLGFVVTGDKAVDMKNSRISQVTLVRINPINCITKYDFIPGSLAPVEKDGTFLGIGYFHLMAGIVQAINSSSNTILNAGKLASTPGGFLAKGFRKAKGALQYKIGQFIPTLMSAEQLQTSVREFNFPETSQSFFMFNDKMRQEIERIAASADLTDSIGANAPATTMLGMVQEKMVPLSAITQRVYRSLKDEFIKLADLNRKYTDPIVYKELVEDLDTHVMPDGSVMKDSEMPAEGQEAAIGPGEGPEQVPQGAPTNGAAGAPQQPQQQAPQGMPEPEEISFQKDYGLKGLDVMPAANPEMTSKILNLTQSTAVLDQADRILQYGGNPIPVMKQWLSDIDYGLIDEVFPMDEQQPNPQLESMRQAQQMEQQLAQGQLELMGKTEERLTAEGKKKFVLEKNETKARIKKIISETILNVEKAETEETKNKISKYTTEMQSLLDMFDDGEKRGAADRDRQDREKLAQQEGMAAMEFDYNPMTSELTQRGPTVQ